jgi:hypothetical protein
MQSELMQNKLMAPEREHDGENVKVKDAAGRVSALAAVFATVVVVTTFLWSANRGFDLTDEGYHLQVLRHPGRVPLGATQFGGIVRVLTLGQTLSVSGYRILGLILLEVTAVVAAIATQGFIRERLPTLAPGLPPRVAIVCTAMVGAALGYSWLPRTISFLILTSSMLCLMASACLALCSSRSSRHRDPVLAVGLGAAATIALFSRPSAAMLGLVVCGIGLLFGIGVRRTITVAVWVGVTLILGAALMQASGWFSLGGLLHGGAALSGNTHSTSRLLHKDSTEIRRIAASVIFGAAVFALVVVSPWILARVRRPWNVLSAAASASIGSLAFLATFKSGRAPFLASPTLVFAAIGGMLTGLLVVALIERQRAVTSGEMTVVPYERGVASPILALSILLLGLPFAGSIGSVTGLLEMALSAGALLALFTVCVFAALRVVLPTGIRYHWLVALPLVLFLTACSFRIVAAVGQDLYRVPSPAHDQTYGVSMRTLAGVHVDKSTRALLEDTAAAVAPYHIAPGSPILAPLKLEGVVYALDGYIPALDWLDNGERECVKNLTPTRGVLAKTQLILRTNPQPAMFEQCFRQVVPGYPHDFEVVRTIPLDPQWQREIGVKGIDILRRR